MSWVELDQYHLVRADTIVVVANATLAGSKRLLASVKGTRYQLELTAGRRRQSLLLLNSGHLIISALSVEEVKRRLVLINTQQSEGKQNHASG